MKHNPEHFAGSPASIPWQQEWIDHYSCDVPTCVPYPRAPLSVLLERAALRSPGRSACTLYGRSMTYAELDDRARRLATSLVRLGAGPGRHVGLLLPNVPEYLIALQATWLTGATALQLSPLMVAEELHHWLEAEGMLGVLPFFHSYGLSVTVLACWAKAGTVHLYPRFDTKAVLQILEKQRPELVPAVPAMLSGLNALLRKRPHDLSFIRTVISGAAALDPNVRREFESFGAHEVVEGYGLTEASPVTHANLRGEGNKPGTIGVPLVDTEAKVVDPATGREELPAGATGELVVRGPQVMKGYFNNPLATEAVLRDGWLYTGDMARRDSDGYFTLVDRKKDIIKTSGFLVFPAEVEEVLMAFASVAEAAVVGQPDAEKGEVVKAMLVPREGAKIDLAALEEHCKLHLGKHKRPRQVEVVSQLPKNFLGKVLRRRLREVAVVPSPNSNGQARG